MISENIKVFIRSRPQLVDQFQNKTDKEVNGIQSVSVDGKCCSYYSANTKTVSTFSADKFFDQNTQQNQLFNEVAKPIVESSLLGYSGTILAYGPTSSGKTFSMRGGEGSSRGIIPRFSTHSSIA
jgi:kinesin family protein 6/9